MKTKEKSRGKYKQKNKASPGVSVNLQVWRSGSVPPLVHLLCDDGATQRAALLPVEPQGDAFVAEYVLGRQRGTASKPGLRAASLRPIGPDVCWYLADEGAWLPVFSLTDGTHVSGLAALTPSGR